jgi:hypothetical protein
LLIFLCQCGWIAIFKSICAHWSWQLTIDKGNKPRRITHCGHMWSWKCQEDRQNIWQWGAIGGFFSFPQSDCDLQTLKLEAKEKLHKEMVEIETFCTKVLNPMNKGCIFRPGLHLHLVQDSHPPFHAPRIPFLICQNWNQDKLLSNSKPF